MIEARPFATGTTRHVYRMKSDSFAIVKKSIRPDNFANMLEWMIWLGAANRPVLASVLGRCHCLSDTGQYLIMERLDDIGPDDYQLIPDVPAWLNDRKPCAFGKREGVIKVRDYGMVIFDELLNQSLVKPPAFAVDARMTARLKELRGG